MINFGLRILSLIICIALLAGGAYLTYITSDINALTSDFVEVFSDNEKYPWIVGANADEGSEQ